MQARARAPRARGGRKWIHAGSQALAFAILGGLLVLMFHATSANLQSRGIHSGFDFLWKPSVTPVFDSPLSFEPGVDTYARAFAAGALNSVKMTLAAIVAASVIGLAVGLGRLSPNALARAVGTGYVELMRNVPVLLHVIFWYGIARGFPAASDAAPGSHAILLTNRGIHLGWLALDAHGLSLDLPAVDGLEIRGGISMSPEFFALFIGISLYTAAFIAEIVRASVGSVDRGQWEATSALGLSRSATLYRVVLPQALRGGLPPLSSEYMGSFKNSTLAVAVGYSDFMAISNTMLTDTGQAVEIMAIVMLFYAVVSLVVSAAMHAFEHRNMRWGAK
jgi:general L-amino acid transport system permease protein